MDLLNLYFISIIIAATIMITPTLAQEPIKLVAVVDADAPHNYQQNLERAVSYVNKESGLLTGYDVILDIVPSRDNESFGIMDEVCNMLPSGLSVILDLSTRYVTSTMRSLSETMGIIHVASVDPSYYSLNPNTYNVSINVEPPESVMLKAIREIVQKENLTNVGIIYDDTFNLDDKPKRLLRNVPAQHLYLHMADNDEAITKQLDKIKSAELSHLFLACSNTGARAYLGKASAKGMLTFKYSWYIVTMDAKISCSECNRRSSIVTLTGKTSYDPMLKYLSFIQDNFDNGFERDNIEVASAFQFDLVHLIAKTMDSMILTSGWTQYNYTDCYSFTTADAGAVIQATGFRNTLQTVDTSGVFGPISWTAAGGVPQVTLDIKRIAFEGGSIVEDNTIGNWTESGGLRTTDSITNTNVKKMYRVVTIMEPPFVFVDTSPPKSEKEEVKYFYYNETTKKYYFGYCIDLLYQINATMDFEFTLFEPEDGVYGTMQPDGSWNGMVNELIQDRADIAVAPLSVMAERENVIDFTVPYYDLVGITILMKKPPFSYHVFKFMSVLEEAVWGCILSAFIIVSVLLAVFDRYSPYSYQNNKDSWDGQGEEPRIFTLKEGLWFCMTSLTPQGGGEAPRALSGRLVAATWWVFGFIMIATYTANLAAFLTVSRLDQPIESLDDLAKQFKTKYAPQESTSTETYFRRMADIEDKFYTIWKSMSLNDSLDQVERAKLAVWDYPVSDKFTNMWSSMKSSGFPKNFGEAIQRIKNAGIDGNEEEDFAFIGDATQNKYATLTDCDLWEVGEEFSRKPYALAVQEGSPLKNELSSRILQLLNQRVLEDLKTIWWDYNSVECQNIESESDGISINNIGGVFLVILIGIGLGLITLAFEYYWYKWRPASSANKETTANGTTHNNVISVKSSNGGIENNAFDTRS